MLKIKDSRGKDLFIVDDDAKEPRQVSDLEKKEKQKELEEEEIKKEEEKESDA